MLSEKLQLIALRFLVSYSNLIEFIRVSGRYYRDIKFLRLDLYLLRSYVNKSPYQIAKQFLQAKGEVEIYTYGETPLTTIDFIAHECQITADDRLYELGCGRGRACFWLHHFIGCQVVGIEHVPQFVEIALKVKRKFGLKGITYKKEDILNVDYKDATVIYFYGTCSDARFIQKLIAKLAKLPKKTKVITVSYPLTAYTTKPIFEVIKTFPARFTWGVANVYLHIVM